MAFSLNWKVRELDILYGLHMQLFILRMFNAEGSVKQPRYATAYHMDINGR
jgi:hypothetical protein